jgi:hypothetical protein
MTLKQRVDGLEGRLSPRAATLLWLTEAHAFGSSSRYTAWLVDQPSSAYPLNRVPYQAKAAAAAGTKGLPAELTEEATRKAVRDALFLVNLIFAINLQAEEATRFEGLRSVALSEGMGAITLGAELATYDPIAGGTGHAQRWADWLATARSWLSHLYVAEDARVLLERRYLDGRPSLFPELASEWASVLECAEALVGLAHRLSVDEPARSRGSMRMARPKGLDLAALRAAAQEGVEAEAARLVDAARADTLCAMGDFSGAAAIVKKSLGS